MSEMSTPNTHETSALPVPQAGRWQMLRAGIQNLWEYDNQRFVFERGRLLLRGRNESGKTKAVEVLLPFLLDANLSPARLDPFGSTARSMRWNLINEGTPGSTNVTVGYVWIEFGMLTDLGPRYFTIGAGMRAKRSQSNVDVWFFTSELRVDAELALFDERRVPMARGSLKRALEGRGAVYETRTGYRDALVAQLFDMPSEQYDALIEALLQLRRPQLSKSLKPGELSRILSDSLPPLAESALEPLAEGFQRLDRLRGEREELMAMHDELKKFLRAYTRYVGVVAKIQARGVTQADSAYHRERAGLRARESELEALAGRRQELADELVELERGERAWIERQRTLLTSDQYQAVKELEDAERLADERQDEAAKARRACAQEEAVERRCRGEEEAARASHNAQESVVAGLRPQVHRKAEVAVLAEVHAAVEQLLDAGERRAARGTVQAAIKRRRYDINALAKLTDAVDARSRALRDAEARLRERQEDEREASERFQAAEDAEVEATEQLLEAIEAWAEGAEELDVGEGDREALLASDLAAMHGRVQELASPRFAALAQRRGSLEVEREELEERRVGLARALDELASATHSPPQPPVWRDERGSDRPGAPLYLLCDFRSDDVALQGRLEAALEASGLLDAWVTPDGSLLDRSTHDVVLTSRPRSGATLFDELRPTPAGGVCAAAIERILRTVALVDGDGDAAGSGCWIDRDGSFGVGPLRGAWAKAAPAYVGATARELARQRKIAEVEAALEALDADARALEEAVRVLAQREEKLHTEVSAFPSVTPVAEARSDVASRHRSLVVARDELERAAQRREEAAAAANEAQRALDVAAGERGLSAWVGGLDELREKTASYADAANDLFHEIAALESWTGALEQVATRLVEAERRVEEARSSADEAAAKETTATAKVEALQGAIGANREEFLAQLREARERIEAIQKLLPKRRAAESAVAIDLGKAQEAVASAEDAVRSADATREEQRASFQAFAGDGHLELLGVDLGDGLTPWSWTETLRVAREVDGVSAKYEATEGARDLAENALTRRYQELAANLLASIQVTPTKERGVLVYRCAWNGRVRRVVELIRDIEGDVAERDELLSAAEHRLFESFLSGETHDHLRGRLRAANTLVKEINAQLEERPTASGMRIRLDWGVAPDTAPGTAQAIDLMLRGGNLLTEDDRRALRGFLQQRLEEARDSDGQGTLLERMLAVLDYRAWHSFTIKYKREGERWRTLTRKAHGAGSGGQKAVMLHMPLFAAAAAFYSSAAPTAPRLIVLDEAFAGIDRAMRGQLMGLLAEFDLDFVMTSFEEWGFYKELDGLSTYHLSRERGMPGVYAERFLWDGVRAHELGAS